MEEQALNCFCRASSISTHPFTFPSSLFTPSGSCYIPQDSLQPPSQTSLPYVTSEFPSSPPEAAGSSETLIEFMHSTSHVV